MHFLDLADIVGFIANSCGRDIWGRWYVNTISSEPAYQQAADFFGLEFRR